jgi:hypothetical protein
MTYVIVACNRKLLQKEQRKGIRLSRTHVIKDIDFNKIALVFVMLFKINCILAQPINPVGIV